MSKDRHRNRIAHNRIELKDKTIGKLLVLEDTGRKKGRRPIWKCRCNCGVEVEVSSKYLLNGDTKSCGCITEGNAHNRDAVGEISASLWNPIVKQAVRRGIPFHLTREQAWAKFIEQSRCCKLTGITLTFALNLRDQRDNQTASLDRIDSSKGYTEDNIQWVHKIINIMKNDLSEKEFKDWCHKVTNTV